MTAQRTITFSKDATTVTLPAPRPGGQVREVKHQATGLTAGGTRYVYDKGVDRYEIDIVIESISASEKSDLDSFFHTTIDGVMNTFTYTDSAGNTFTARFLSPQLKYEKVARGIYDVSFTLEINSMAD